MIESGEPLNSRTSGTGGAACVRAPDRLYQPFLWSTNSAEYAADLTHDTFVAFWQSRDRFDDRRPFKPWLYGIARNFWRSTPPAAGQGNRKGEIGPGRTRPRTSPMQTLLSKETGCMLEEAVAQLSPDYREAVVLRFWEDLDYGEISEALAISEGLARWRVYQPRKMLLQKPSKAGLTTENSSAAAPSLAGGCAFTRDQARRSSYSTAVSLPSPRLNLSSVCPPARGGRIKTL